MKKTIPLAYVTMLALLLAAALSVLVFSGPKSSELENRTLADPPMLTGESFSSGLFADQTEAFAEDHFPLRDQAVMLNATVNHLLGMTARQNVSLGPKGFFFDTSDGWSRRNVDLNLQAVQEIHEAAGIPTVVALVPSSGLILAGSLPEKPASGDRDELYAAEIPEGVLRVDLRETLRTAPDPEALYYRTDHHWTLDGAALGYRAVCGALGLDPEPVSVRAAFPGFRGTLYARFPTLLAPEDTLLLPEVDHGIRLRIGEEEMDGLYDPEAMRKRDKYAALLYGNHGIVTLENDASSGVLFVLRDSYANALLPLLARHYGKIIAADPRYYTGDILSEIHESEADELLCLFGMASFSQSRALSLLDGL